MKVHPDKNAPDGVKYELTQEEFDSGYTHVCITGPIAGTVTMSDGTVYDVTDKYVAVRTEHAGEIEKKILDTHHNAGRFLNVEIGQ